MSLVGDYVGNFLASEAGQQVAKSAIQLGSNLLNKQANGINYAAPAVTRNGNVAVPVTQAGNGVFASLPNYLAGFATDAIDKVVSSAAGSVSGVPIVSQGGGVALTGSVQTLQPVTTNTTYNSDAGWKTTSSDSGTSMWTWLIIAIGVIFFLPKLFRR